MEKNERVGIFVCIGMIIVGLISYLYGWLKGYVFGYSHAVDVVTDEINKLADEFRNASESTTIMD